MVGVSYVSLDVTLLFSTVVVPVIIIKSRPLVPFMFTEVMAFFCADFIGYHHVGRLL